MRSSLSFQYIRSPIVLLITTLLFCVIGPPAHSQVTNGPWRELPDPFASGYKSVLTDLVVAPDGTVYASAFRAGVAKSTDGGQTWTLINSGLTDLRVVNLGLNSLGEPVASVGTKPAVGVFRYSGGHWSQAQNISANAIISRFTVDRTGALIAVTGWAGDVFRSTDNGGSFYKAADSIGHGSGALWTVYTGSDGSLYAGGEIPGGLFVSKDNGANWTEFGLSTTQGYKGNLEAVILNKQGELLVSRTQGNSGSCIQRFTGGNWVESSKGIPDWRTALSFAIDNHGVLYTIAISHGGSGVYRSTDGGQTWQDYSFGLTSPTYRRVAVDSHDNVYLVALNEIYKARASH